LLSPVWQFSGYRFFFPCIRPCAVCVLACRSNTSCRHSGLSFQSASVVVAVFSHAGRAYIYYLSLVIATMRSSCKRPIICRLVYSQDCHYAVRCYFSFSDTNTKLCLPYIFGHHLSSYMWCLVYYILHDALPKQDVYWSRTYVCVCVCLPYNRMAGIERRRSPL